ncbi:ornithine carbamoyltransferase [Chromobacterium violaceum]|uniref:ornithine carbamoyltransferase n=1 Tax=Chromobacterium violaceum TaxID=536 RepID=UPI0009D98551|nr:ornithine carbamoyltransferase [Chromobacterium violaceum]ATP28572.1 ornithine carbamoyltransferase [Chromobacterium violaceum]ATP32482.1 ornithine carbamoyltransferase [Chromobacterium violaceum]MBP4049981.1 ornithine carbamoyltransferase [Chromobacterium violaceum]OQS25424.1 ornithine carbamoyltransferase [Chromobacterium violaceum]
MTSVRHYLQFSDLSPDEYHHLFERSRVLKRRQSAGELHRPLVGKVMSMVFEKNSTRTRVSFEAGMAQLGGHAMFLDTKSSQIGRGEPIEDTARVLSRMSDIIMIRTFEQGLVQRLAAHSRVPVINGLTNEYHPCQVLADIFTYVERHGSIKGRTVAWVGDGNNVCRTWLQAAAVLGFKLKVASPLGYELQTLDGRHYGSDVLEMTRDPARAVHGADIVTTDVFTSMGFEAEQAARREAFEGYQVTAELMKQAKPDALFMHCLPAHRGEEVAAEVIDGPQSVVWDEAENRMHVQKALIEYLLLGHRED